MKKNKVKDKFLEVLEKTPIIQHACEQCGIARNTYYRWIKEDPIFLALVNERISIGVDLVNDVAESHLLNAIKKADHGMIKYWLSSRHKAFRRPLPKVSVYDHFAEEQRRIEMEKDKKEMEEWEARWFEEKKS